MAGSSSHYPQWGAINGFLSKIRLPSGVHGWCSRSQPLPHFIWYQFKETFRPAKVTFLPRNNDWDQAVVKTPTQFQFIGTNDENCNPNSVWTILCADLTANSPSSFYGIRQCKVDAPLIADQLFRCLGLKVLKVGEGVQMACVHRIRFWVWN